MIDPLVREAVAADARELRVLERLAREHLVGARGGDRWLQEHSEIGERWDLIGSGGDQPAEASAGAADICRCFVAVLDEFVVGYLVSLLGADGIVRIDQVFVRAEARECGFGDALLEAATDTARADGAIRIEGEALPGDRDTKNLYERAGITARLITVSAPLSDPSTAGRASR